MKEMVGGCCVCSDEQGSPENPLVYCDGDGCTVAVHQACYGIITVPQGPWFCRRCESQERAAKVRCELCPQRDGALKRTDSGGWAHVICALYIPEVRFGNVSTMEPIMLGSLPADRYHKSCYICESKGKESKASFGACMQCNKSTCKNYFHVTCAQAEGLLCEEAGNFNDNVKYCGYCGHHYKKILESSEKVPSKDSKRFTLVTSRKDYPNIKPIPAFRPIPSNIPGLKSPEVEKNKPFNSSLSSSSSSLSSSSSSLSSFKQSIGLTDKYGGKSRGEDKFSRTNSTDKLLHDKDRKISDDKNKDKDSMEKEESSKKKSSKSSKDHHHSTGSKSEKGSKVTSEKDKEKTSSSSSSSNAMSSVTSLTTSTNCTGLTSLSTLNDLNSTSRPFDDRVVPSGQFSLSSFIDPKLKEKNQSKKAAEKDAKASLTTSGKEKSSSSSTSKEPAKCSNSTFGSNANGGHSSSKLCNSKLDSSLIKSKDSVPSDSKSAATSSKNTHEKYVDKKGSTSASGHSASSSSKRKTASDVKSSTSKSSSSTKKRKRIDASPSSSSDSEAVEDQESTDDSENDEEETKNRKITSSKTKGKVDESKVNKKSRTKKIASSKSTTKGNKKADSSYVNGTSGSKAKSVNGTKQASVARKKKSKLIITSDEDEDEDDETKSESLEEDNSSNGTEPNLDDVEPKPKSKKSSLKESSSASTGGTGGGGSNRQERRVINKSNGYILPSPSPSLTPMTNKDAPTGHNVDMDRVVCQPPPPSCTSFAIPPPPTSRVSRENQAKDPTEPPASSLEALLERQWAQGAHFILDQAQHYDIASLLSCLSQLRQDNARLEEHLRQLTSRREHLLAVNARLALPLNGSFNTSHGSLSTTASAASSSSSLPPTSSPFLPPPPQPPLGFQQLLNAAAVLQTPSNSVTSYEHSSRNSSTRSSALGDGSNSNIAINGTRYGNDPLSNFYNSTALADGTASPHHALHGGSSSRPSSRSSPYGSGVNSL